MVAREAQEAQDIIHPKARRPATKAVIILIRGHLKATHNREATTLSLRQTLSTFNNSPKKVAEEVEELAWPAWLVLACVAVPTTSAIACSNRIPD